MEGEPRRDRRPIPKRFTRSEILAGMESTLATYQAAKNKETARRELVDRMRETATRYFSGMEVAPEMESVVDDMDRMLRDEDPAFCERMAGRIASVFERIYADEDRGNEFDDKLRGLEREDRHLIVEKAEGVPLSPEWMLYGNIGDDDVFRLHVAVGFTLSATEKMRDLQAGMRELARRVAHDPTFENVRQIEGTSWIVGEHPELIARLGFHVAERDLTDEEKKEHFAGEKRNVRKSWMSRDELIAQYGKKQTP